MDVLIGKRMTLERATAFGAAWNSREPDLIANSFVEDSSCHASVSPDHLGRSFHSRDEIRCGVQIFLDRFSDGRFENLRV